MNKILKKCGLAVSVILCLWVWQYMPVFAEGTYQDFKYEIDNSTMEITIKGYIGTNPNITIPASINGYEVTKIYMYAFEDNKTIQTVQFEKGTHFREIGYSAFDGCSNLKKITLPSSLKVLSDASFINCSNLEKITIPEGVTYVTESEHAGNGTFNGCVSLKEVILPSTLKTIGQNAFYGCKSLKQISIPAGVSLIGSCAFEGSGLQSINIPAGVGYIGFGTFRNCGNLEKVTMSNNIKVIEDRAFENCSKLKTINIPLDLEKIGYGSFSGCTVLRSLKFGDIVTSIAAVLFDNCPLLTVEVVRGSWMEAYCMNADIPFHTYASKLAGCKIDGIKDKPYNGEAQTQNLTITAGTTRLELNKDYTVSYSNNIDAGVARLKIQGIGNYVGDIEKTFNIIPINISKCKLKLKNTSCIYNAKRQYPACQVTYNGKIVDSGNYDILYSDNLYVGKATVTISGSGNFTNYKKLTFNILPKTVQISKLYPISAGFTVKWKSNTIQTTGYQIQYSKNKTFSVGTKSLTVGYPTATSQTISGLNNNKLYFVRMRTYKTVNGKKYYSNWSKTKSVKTTGK